MSEIDKRFQKGTHSRRGSLNYNAEDMQKLLDLVADIEPLGRNHWARVAEKFMQWAEENDRPRRTAESLKDKFDHLAYTRKPTGDPHMPPEVRRAKQIYRDIQAKAQATVLGNHDENLAPSEKEIENARRTSGVVGESRKRRLTDNPRLPLAKRMQVDIAKHMETMKTTTLDIAECIKSSVQKEGSVVSISAVQDLVRKETEAAMRTVLKELLPRQKTYPVPASAPAVLPSIGEIFQSPSELRQCLDESENEM